jgi:uncharacterized protein (TIGR03067 family)
MTARALVLCAAGLLIAVELPAQESDKQDLEKLQGDWVLHSQETKGKVINSGGSKTYTVKGNEYTFGSPMSKGGKVKFTIDASKDPKTIDTSASSSPVRLGIYKVEGDTLTICHETGSGIRPTEFKTTQNGGSLVVWKRVAKAK